MKYLSKSGCKGNNTKCEICRVLILNTMWQYCSISKVVINYLCLFSLQWLVLNEHLTYCKFFSSCKTYLLCVDKENLSSENLHWESKWSTTSDCHVPVMLLISLPPSYSKLCIVLAYWQTDLFWWENHLRGRKNLNVSCFTTIPT